MLFDTEPKTSLSDLFGREEEVEKLKGGLNERLILILGIRRIGKSSLILSTLNSLGVDYAFVDVRKVYDSSTRKVYVEKLLEEIYSSLTKLSKKAYVRNVFEKLGIEIEYPVRVRVKDDVKDSLNKVFEALNEIGLRKGKIPIVFDEAQYLKYSTLGLRPFFAHVYDYMRGITLIVTGSEVGLLHDFLSFDEPKSELYGRYYFTVELKSFNEDKSKEFLRRGFKEVNVEVKESVIEEAVKELDGIVGWLVYFGKLYLEKKEEAIEEVKEIGSNLVREELKELEARSPYYLLILKAVASLGKARWKNIMDYVTASTGKRVSNTTLFRELNKLKSMGFIERNGEEYRIADPIVRYAVLK
ncbi:ATPase AAA [Sulfolobales archaeon HS-7]|nr:ATPase AAA [Sulfolobales archaeon HS-7]